MNDTVYVLGSGANREVEDRDNLSPPLINEFFQVASKKDKFSGGFYMSKLQIVYDYIYKYWGKSKSELTSIPFDLEECFTMLELQLREAIAKNEVEESKRLRNIQFRLKSLVAELLSEFEVFAYTSDIMRLFGEVLYEEKPIIVTFNYDCFIEAIIEIASKGNPSIPQEMFNLPRLAEETKVSDDELAYSHFNWNRPLGYGIAFDVVQLHRAGIHTYVDGNRFYSHPKNQLYSLSILKLHGSLNWFRYLPIRKYPLLSEELEVLPKDKENNIILMDSKYRWWFGEPPDLNGWYVDPILITPTLHKEEFLYDPVYGRVFAHVWQKAKEALCNCRKLIVIGYSFPPTDFLTKKLFLEAFSEHAIEELVVVNPDTSIVQKVKALCNFEKPVMICRGLKEFLHEVD
jgi:hypothetical protein